MKTSMLLSLLLLSAQGWATPCEDLATVFKELREERSRGYSIKRDKWLSCLERQANQFRATYCRANAREPGKTARSVKRSLVKACKAAGVKPG